MKKAYFIVATLLILLSVSGCDGRIDVNRESTSMPVGNIDQTAEGVASETIDDAISKVIFSYNTDSYLRGEVQAEGHIILTEETRDEEITVYALVEYGEYGFENNRFIKISGSGSIPVRIIFTISGNGEYIFEIDNGVMSYADDSPNKNRDLTDS